jgi:hypothetical protein
MAVLKSKRWAASREQLTSRKKSRCHVIKEKEVKRRIPQCGGGGQDGVPSHPPPPQEAGSPPKQADLVKGAFSHVTAHVTVSPKVAKGPDVASHMTSADLGSKSSFSRKFLNKWFQQETSLAK